MRTEQELRALIKPYTIQQAKKYLEAVENKRKVMVQSNNPIIMRDGCYLKQYGEKDGDMTRITNFIIEPKCILESKDGTAEQPESRLRCNLVRFDGAVKENVEFTPDAWTARQKFLKAVNDVNFKYIGNDYDLQHIVEKIIVTPLEKKVATNIIGFYENQFFVAPAFVIGADGIMEDTPVEYSKLGTGGSAFSEAMKINDAPIEAVMAALKLLPKVNAPEVIMPSIGWFSACFYRTFIKEKISYFPILTFFGSSGSGKTHLALQLWRLFGINNKDMLLSAHSSRFSIISTFSSTNCIPVIVDEIKAGIGKDAIEFWKQMIRSAYGGEIELRGRADMSLVKFSYQAPLMLIGEMNVIKEVATTERTIQITIDANTLKGATPEDKAKAEEYKKSYHALRASQLDAFLFHYVKWLIEKDFAMFHENWQAAREVLFSYFVPNNLSDRVVDNFTVVIFGLMSFQRFMAENGEDFAISRDDMRSWMNAQVGQIITMVGRQKCAFDEMVECLALLSKEMKIQNNKHFRKEGDDVFIHFASCLPMFKRWVREHNYEGEVADRKEYLNFAREMVGKTYLKKTNMLKKFGGTPYRTMHINLKEAEEAGLDISGFMSVDESYSGSGQWGQDKTP